MLKSHILTILRSSPAAGVMVTVLRQEAAIRIRKQIGDIEWQNEIDALVSRNWIDTTGTDDMTGDRLIKLTAAGRKAAASV